MWKNFRGEDCPKCGCRSALFGYGGSPLSGAGAYARWFCPECGKTFDTVPGTPLARFIDTASRAARKTPSVEPCVESAGGSLPAGIRPENLKRVFGGRLLDAYIRLAVRELEERDRGVTWRLQGKTT